MVAVPGAPWGDASAPFTPSPAKAGVRERFVVDVGFPGEAGTAGSAQGALWVAK